MTQSNSSHLHSFTRSAFTLIELLVVIAIITFAADVTDLESGRKGRSFTINERDLLILRAE